MIQFTSPNNNQAFKVGIDVKFTVQVGAGVANVMFKADSVHDLGVHPVVGGKASFTRKFNGSGPKTITAVGIDGNDDFIVEDPLPSIKVVIQPDSLAGAAGQTVLDKMASFAKSELSRGTLAVRKDVRKATGNQSNWCVSFCCWVYKNAAGKNPTWGSMEHHGSGFFETWTPDMVLWAQENGLWIRNQDIHKADRHGEPVPNLGQPGVPALQPGFLVVYGDTINFFGGMGRQNYPHIGVLTSVNGSNLGSVEGNVGGGQGLIGARKPNLNLKPVNFVTDDPNTRYVAGFIVPPK